MDELQDVRRAVAESSGDEGRAGRLARAAEIGSARLDELRRRVGVVDTAMRIVERDRDAAGTLLGSALALRLFLFFVPLALLVVGLAGVIGSGADVGSVSDAVDLKGSLAQELDAAFQQDPAGAWLAVLAGLVGVAWTGRSLTRALVLSSALSWRLRGRQKTPMRVVGIVMGITVGMALIWVLENMVRQRFGLAAASVSFLAIVAVYAVLWSLLFLALPRNTRDPGATIPGAMLVAVLLAGMQAVSQLYLPGRIDATSVYGIVGAAIAVLGWFFVIGRGLAGAFALNAVLYEEYGSLSGVLFSLPVLRLLPQRWPAFARFFDLEPASAQS